MIPNLVKFTGLEIAPHEVLASERKVAGPIPADWPRYQFDVEGNVDRALNRFDAWVEANLDGRWSSYSFTKNLRETIVVFFEENQDAMAFRMLDGHLVWSDEN